MSYARCYRGLQSGLEYSIETPMNLDPADSRPVEIVIDTERLAAEQPHLKWYHPERSSLWRFGALLALDPDDPDDQPHITSLGEGHTPMLDAGALQLGRAGHGPVLTAESAGLTLTVKDEGSHWPGFGGNPTFSFKDRGMAMTISMARRYGITALAVPTQGNAGDSLSQYALAAGMDCVVIMPDDTPMPIMGKVAALAHRYSSQQLDLVQGTIREAGMRMKEHWLPKGYFNVATFQEPGWRIEGKKTLGLEIAEPDQAGGRWSLPDVILYPTGGGTGILGMWKAFDELEALGLIGSHRPRIYSIQSDQTTPIVNAWQAGQADTTPVAGGQTLAVGLNVPGGVGHFRVLDILRQSGGGAIAISEGRIADLTRSLWQQTHWWLCPEGVACLAAVEPLLDQGLIRSGESVVVINTGSAEKYLPELRHLLR